MSTVKKWSVDVFIWEDDEGHTSADARLVADNHTVSLVGRGIACVKPQEHDVPEIGDEVAVGRALGDLSRNLLVTADADIRDLGSAVGVPMR
jgi:hypothetical protein